MLAMTPGKHTLEFSKEGYATASTPVETVANALPGSVEIELNSLTLDTVVLRDGTVLLGDVASMTATAININLKGKAMKLDRSRVARIVLGRHQTIRCPAPSRALSVIAGFRKPAAKSSKIKESPGVKPGDSALPVTNLSSW